MTAGSFSHHVKSSAPWFVLSTPRMARQSMIRHVAQEDFSPNRLSTWLAPTMPTSPHQISLKPTTTEHSAGVKKKMSSPPLPYRILFYKILMSLISGMEIRKQKPKPAVVFFREPRHYMTSF